MNPTHIVISKELIQEVPKMEKPEFSAWEMMASHVNPSVNEKIKAYEKHLASLPTIQRADNGKWKEGQGLRIGVDFEIRPSAIFVSGNYSNKCCSCGKQFRNTDKLWFLCQECCNEPVAIPIEQQGSNPDNELIDFANAISMKAFAELAEQQEQPTPQAEEEEELWREALLKYETLRQMEENDFSWNIGILKQSFTITRKQSK